MTAPSVAPHEVQHGGRYVVAYHHGDTFTSAVAGWMFVNGVVTPAPVDGATLRRSGVLRVAHAWEYREGYSLRWVKDSWVYSPAVVAPPRAAPPPPVPVADPPSDRGADSGFKSRGKGRTKDR